jgi:hypothetical protein
LLMLSYETPLAPVTLTIGDVATLIIGAIVVAITSSLIHPYR